MLSASLNKTFISLLFSYVYSATLEHQGNEKGDSAINSVVGLPRVNVGVPSISYVITVNKNMLSASLNK